VDIGGLLGRVLFAHKPYLMASMSTSSISAYLSSKQNPEEPKKETSGISEGKGAGITTRGCAGCVEMVTTLPLALVALPLWGVFRVLGEDPAKNQEDESKARFVYEGMSKNDLLTYIGQPKEKYMCIPKGQYQLSKEEAHTEVWVYRKDQVLRGGRALVIGSGRGEVLENSYDPSFFKKWIGYDFLLIE
jgi:hypothetical protein